MTVLSAIPTEDEIGKRLDRFFSDRFEEVSRSRAKTLIKEGSAATIDGAATDDPRAAVLEGKNYVLTLPEPVAAVPEPENIPLDILHEDEHLIVINKPSGMAVHPAPGSWTGTLVNALLHHCEGQLPGIGGVERPGIVHRLDKLTTGVMVCAKTEAAHRGLSEQFADHSIERAYMAFTRGAPRPLVGTVDERIARSKNDRKKMAVLRNPDSEHGRHAITHYQTKASFGLLDKTSGLPAAALIECRLETGRTHQIRVHMAHIGAPLIGDPVYGKNRGIRSWGKGDAHAAATTAARKLPRQALHAAVLGFQHPISKRPVRFEQALPNDLVALKRLLEKMPKG